MSDQANHETRVLAASDASPMLASCTGCRARSPVICSSLTQGEVADIQSVRRENRTLRARQLLMSAGDTVSSVFTVLSGWAFRFKVLPDGHRRILSYYIPGDFLATEALLNPHVNFSIEALTDMSLCVFDRDKLLALVDENRALRQKVIYLCSRKLESLDNRIAYIGTRPAGEKLAHFFMHFYGRLVRKGLIAGDRFELPLRHEHIADTLGLTSVHVSRTLSELKRAGLIEIQNHAIHILDQPSMLMLAGLDSDYLSKAYAERKAS